MPEAQKPPRGLVTFDSEGVESPGSRFHSRVLHVPGGASGVTIGRGYDMKMKSRAKIEADLIEAGVPAADAKKISAGAGLSGAAAQRFRDAHKDFEISQEAQVKLFAISYREEEAEVKRICNKPDCIAAFGRVDWDKVHPAIRDIIVDLKFRGDYTPASRKLVQRLLANNDLKGIAACIANRANWSAVPSDRFTRRSDFLNKALAGG